MIDRLVLASRNAGKLREFTRLLAPLAIDVIAQAELGIPDADEPHVTFVENALAKARHASLHAKLPALADDSGVCVAALNGAPGVHSARFGGLHSTYPEKFTKIYDQLRATPSQDRSARFVCALALVDQNRVIFEARGTVEGQIAPEPRGQGGFGYDPIFFYPPFGCTLAEAGDRKSSVSHRGQAFRQLKGFLGAGGLGSR